MKKKRFFLVVAIVTIFGCSEQLSPPIDSISPPVLKKPSYLGWNSWNAFHVKINEQNVISNLDRFIRDLKPAGYEYFILDNGWDGAEEFGVHLDDYGRNLPHPISFPNGFDPIISKAQKSGVKFGLWMVRGVNKEAYRKNLSIEGTSYHFRDIVDTLDTCEWCAQNYGIDMSKPGAQEFYNSKIDLAAQMGVEFIKYDDMIPWSQNQYPQYIEEFNAVVKAIDKAELKYGKRIVLSISPGDGFQSQYSSAYSKADLLRITGDMWDNPNDLNKIYSRWRESHKINMSSTAFDFDMLPFGFFPTYNRYDSLTIEQKYSFITQRALGASPLFMGGDLLSSDLFSINLITNRGMLECNRNGIVGKSVLGNDSVEIWKTPCATNYNSGWFGVFNKTSRVISFDLKPSLLGFSKDVKSYTFVDIWRGKSVEFDSIELKTMPAYGCIFIKYTAN